MSISARDFWRNYFRNCFPQYFRGAENALFPDHADRRNKPPPGPGEIVLYENATQRLVVIRRGPNEFSIAVGSFPGIYEPLLTRAEVEDIITRLRDVLD